MRTRGFWVDVFERAASTFAQALAALLAADGLGVTDAPWPAALSVAAMAALLSVLKSVAATKVGDPDTGALLPSDQPPDLPNRLDSFGG